MGRSAGFLSYARTDDTTNGGKLTRLRERLGNLLTMFSGQPFDIFQDWTHVAWGQRWEQRITGALDSALFLIPILTPSYFTSPSCRDEFQRFLDRSEQADQLISIFPVYYVAVPELDRRADSEDPLIRAAMALQWDDFRELRLRPIDHELVEERLNVLAQRIYETTRTTEEASAQFAPPGQYVPVMVQVPTISVTMVTDSELIVDPGKAGCHSTITSAVEAADEGASILIRPGLYDESLTIEKPITLTGERGDGRRVVVQSLTAPTVVLSAPEARVTNLHIQHYGDDSAVRAVAGAALLEGCRITSRGQAGVLIDEGATPRLVSNTIRDCADIGVSIAGEGVLEDNQIIFNQGNGILVRGSTAAPSLHGNRIRRSQKTGVFITERATATLLENEIADNARAGVLISQGARVRLLQNTITGNRWHGIYVLENGRGMIERNDLRGNVDGPWAICSDSEVVRVNNIE